MWKRKCFALLIAAAARNVLELQYSSLRWLKTEVFPLKAGELMRVSERGIIDNPKGVKFVAMQTEQCNLEFMTL